MTSGKIELHTHLEGSVSPARLIELADRHGCPHLPAGCLNTAGDGFVFEDFAGFLKLYKTITSVMRTARDFHDMALDLGAKMAKDGVVYAEISVSYAILLIRDLDPLPIQRALHEAAAEIEETLGVRLRWIPDAVRQFEEKWAWRAWEKAATAGRQLGVVGFGLGGDENGGEAARYAKLFAEVKTEGYGVTIHAGENPGMGARGRTSVREAVEDCQADRIGHGLAAAYDPQLLALLRARQTFVELCPGSNVVTGGVATWPDFPLMAFVDAGIACALNTDDRTVFAIDLTGEYERASHLLGLSDEQAAAMNQAAAAAAFGQVPR